MPNKKITWLVFLQAIIIVALFWMLMIYAKDEYEQFQNEQEEEIESPSRVTTKEGVSTVILPLATQTNSGIQTSHVESATYHGEIKTFGTVVPIDALLEAKSKYLSLSTELALSKSGSSQNIVQYQRLKSLNADDKNISDRAVQEALAIVNADKAKILAASSQLKNFQASISSLWGGELAKLIKGQTQAPYLTNLLTQKLVLIQVSLPIQTASPQHGSQIQITPLSRDTPPIQATYISAAIQSDTNGFGKTFFYSAPAEFLRAGMRVNVETDPNKNDLANGVIIPNSAIVWHGGKAWIYVKQSDDQFIRKPIATDVEMHEGWFNQSFKAGTTIVTSGAQLLLSEEFKYLIKNENDD